MGETAQIVGFRAWAWKEKMLWRYRPQSQPTDLEVYYQDSNGNNWLKNPVALMSKNYGQELAVVADGMKGDIR
jgi:hypothetical protein